MPEAIEALLCASWRCIARQLPCWWRVPNLHKRPCPRRYPARAYLYSEIMPPEHMVYVWWGWPAGEDGFRELVVDVSVHNEVDGFDGQHGLYIQLGRALSPISNSISASKQTRPLTPRRETSATSDSYSPVGTPETLAWARTSPSGWNESAGYEGDFISVRAPYDWGVGEYRLRLAPDGADQDGEWFSLWITALTTGVTTWAGSLKFPYHDNEAIIAPLSYANIEIYGTEDIRPIDIPEMSISVEPPSGDGVQATVASMGYSSIDGFIRNSEIHFDPIEGVALLEAGGLTKRKTTHKGKWVVLP